MHNSILKVILRWISHHFIKNILLFIRNSKKISFLHTGSLQKKKNIERQRKFNVVFVYSILYFIITEKQQQKKEKGNMEKVKCFPTE